MDLRPPAEEDSGGEEECEECDLGEHDEKESRVRNTEEEDGRGYLYRPYRDHRSGVEDREANCDCAPAKPHMQAAVPNRDQERLNEKEHKPGGNGETVYCDERKNSGVDFPARHPGAMSVEGAEANEHEQEKDSGGGAVEIPIGFHVGLKRGIQIVLKSYHLEIGVRLTML
jgi:hypothetical protein